MGSIRHVPVAAVNREVLDPKLLGDGLLYKFMRSRQDAIRIKKSANVPKGLAAAIKRQGCHGYPWDYNFWGIDIIRAGFYGLNSIVIITPCNPGIMANDAAFQVKRVRSSGKFNLKRVLFPIIKSSGELAILENRASFSIKWRKDTRKFVLTESNDLISAGRAQYTYRLARTSLQSDFGSAELETFSMKIRHPRFWPDPVVMWSAKKGWIHRSYDFLKKK